MFENLGHRIREYRVKRGIGLNQMADKVGVSPGFLSNFETGKTSSISVNVLDDIVSILDISPLDLLNSDSALEEPITLEKRLDLLTRELYKESRLNPEGASLIAQQLELSLKMLRTKSSGKRSFQH